MYFPLFGMVGPTYPDGSKPVGKNWIFGENRRCLCIQISQFSLEFQNPKY